LIVGCCDLFDVCVLQSNTSSFKMDNIVKILFIGDIVGRLGRRAVTLILPELRKKLKPDFVIANGENLAHGKGVTPETVQEVLVAGVDLLTSGNHIFRNNGYKEVLDNQMSRVIRPANYPEGAPGKGSRILEAGSNQIAVINLMGRIFFRETLDDPFHKLDEILSVLKSQNPNLITVVDWHAEATSEKAGLGWFADGRVSAVLGTHTHVPTADTKILPQGTAFVSDVGMVGARDSMLGVEVTGPLVLLQTQMPTNFQMPEDGVVQFNSVLVEIDPKTGLTNSISRVDKEVQIQT